MKVSPINFNFSPITLFAIFFLAFFQLGFVKLFFGLVPIWSIVLYELFFSDGEVDPGMKIKHLNM